MGKRKKNEQRESEMTAGDLQDALEEAARIEEPVTADANAGDTAETGAEAIAEEQEDPVKALAAERDDFRDKFLRARADIENLRKRAAREMHDARRFGIVPFALAILQVRDNLERTLAACTDTEAHQTLVDGLKLVREQFDKILADFSIKPIEARGKPFDPHLHEAMIMETTGDVPPNTVVEELQTGFLLHDRLIRPSKVKVAQAAGKETDSA